jgi:hypothetical protein
VIKDNHFDQKMKTKKQHYGCYRITHNNQTFEARSVKTDFGWEWILELIELFDPHQYLKPVNIKVEPYETAEWITTEPTLRDCKQVILEKF